METYEQMTTATGREICLKRWVKSSIIKTIENGSDDISTQEPFFETDGNMVTYSMFLTLKTTEKPELILVS